MRGVGIFPGALHGPCHVSIPLKRFSNEKFIFLKMPSDLERENASLTEVSTAVRPQPQMTKNEMSPWTAPPPWREPSTPKLP